MKIYKFLLLNTIRQLEEPNFVVVVFLEKKITQENAKCEVCVCFKRCSFLFAKNNIIEVATL